MNTGNRKDKNDGNPILSTQHAEDSEQNPQAYLS